MMGDVDGGAKFQSVGGPSSPKCNSGRLGGTIQENLEDPLQSDQVLAYFKRKTQKNAKKSKLLSDVEDKHNLTRLAYRQ